MPTEIKQGKSGKWYERTPDGWAETSAPPTPSPSLVQSFVRGVDRSPLFAPQIASDPTLAEKPGFNRPMWNSDGMSDSRYQDLAARNAHQTTFTASIPPADSFSGRVAERLGEGSPMLLGSLVGGGMAGGAWALKDQIIQSVAADSAAQFAQDRGYGRTGQMVAGVVGAMLVPTRAPGFISRRFGSAAAEGAAQGATEQASQAPVRMLSDSEVSKLANKYDVKPDDMREVAKLVQERIRIDPMTGKPQLDDLVNEIDDVMRIFPNPKVRPTFAQAAGELGGGNLVAAEDAITMADPVANARVNGIRAAVKEDLSQRWDSLVGGGSTEGAVDKLASLKEAEKGVKAQAWDEVPFNELPKSPAAPITKTLESMKNNRTLLYRNTPSDVKDMIENFGDEVTARDLQDLRARLGEIVEEGKYATDRSGQMSANAARQLRKVVDDQLKTLPEDGSTAYRKAIDATKSYYDLFPTDSEAVKAFEKFSDRTRIAGTVLRSPKPAEQMDVAMKIFGKTEGGMDDLRSVFMRHLVGENLGDVPMSTVRKALQNEGTSAAYKKLLGPEDFATFKDVLKGYQVGTSGTSGTVAQMQKTQSAHLVQKLTSFISSPGQTIKGAAAAVDEAIAQDAASEMARQKIMNELIFDLELPRKLAQIPMKGASEKEVTSWLATWKTAVARAAVRSQARAASRAPAIARAAVAPMVVNQSMPGQGMGGVR